MNNTPKIKCTVISVKGKCDAGHKVGDEFEVGYHTPAGMCNFAYGAISPFITTLQYGGTFPWSDDPDVVRPGCPDSDNVVTFELRRQS